MSNAKHTPGTWSIVTTDHGYIVTAMDGCYDVAVVRNIGNQDNKANAELIAAAPELLGALEMMCRTLIQAGANEEWDEIIAAKSIIAKARGE